LRSDIIWNKPNPMPESVRDRPTKSHEYLFLLTKKSRYFYDAHAVREPDKGTDHAHRNVLNGQPSLEPSNGLRSANAGLRKQEGRNGTGRNKRSVWTITTRPFPGAHFATFPPDLIDPCVLAGSPPKCCGECGAPWRRVVERGQSSWSARKEAGATRGNVAFNGNVGTGTQRGVHGDGVTHDLHAAPVRTIGWEPTCTHQDDTGRSVVLDPFAGAGTTGMVALRHDRSFVGIELNPEYADMARNRIVADDPDNALRHVSGHINLEAFA
jgi:hypothetical protein